MAQTMSAAADMRRFPAALTSIIESAATFVTSTAIILTISIRRWPPKACKAGSQRSSRLTITGQPQIGHLTVSELMEGSFSSCACNCAAKAAWSAGPLQCLA